MSAQRPETRLPPGTSARIALAHDSADSAGSAAGWDQPIPLTSTARPPAFPVQALPTWLAEFVQAEATATQTPPDLAGMLVLTALAAAAGGLAEVQVRLGWREPLNLFTVTALPPGNRKSAVFRDVARPLVNFDKDETDRMQAIILEALTARRVAERQADEATRRAGKANGGEAELAEAIAAQARAEAIVVPPTPRRLVDDATPEALASLLADHGKVALLSPEGGVFDMMAGRYQSAGGPNLDVYLKAHAGDPIRVDRKTARRPEHVAAPALTIGVTVQPEVLRACKDRPGFRGRGLLARFLYAVPHSTVGYRQVGAPPIPAPVAERYRRELQTLARSLLQEAEAAEMAGSDELIVLQLGYEAAAAMLAFEAELEPRLAPGSGDLTHVADWSSKLAGAVARIVGLLHLAEHLYDGWGHPIELATMQNALTIGRYLTEHALLAFEQMGADPSLDDAQYLLEWIERTARDHFTRRELFTALPRGRFPRVDALESGLAVLVAHGYLKVIDPPKPKGAGRPPSPVYEVTPRWRR
jgi:replicative DNA helicase